MFGHGCAHKAAITDIRPLRKITKPFTEAIAELLFPSDLAVKVHRSGFLNLHPMLVGACEEHHAVRVVPARGAYKTRRTIWVDMIMRPSLALVPCNDICGDERIEVSDVGRGVGVENGSCYVEWLQISGCGCGMNIMP